MQKKRKNVIFLIEIIILIAISTLNALAIGRYADFIPINGTFQNFNPVRRMLAGQVPYKDFQDYLGMGHLYLGTFFTLLWGGSYRASLMAFAFLNFLSLILISMVLGSVLLKTKEAAAAVTCILCSYIVTQHILIGAADFGFYQVTYALYNSLKPGNSARFIRGMIMPVSCIILWLLYVAYNKQIRTKIKEKYRNIAIYSCIGVVAGFSFVWSNDYGISCWLCIFVMSFWVSLSRNRKFLPSLLCSLIELVSSIVSIFVFVEIFTLGHFEGWLRYTFGTGGYQSWYFNSDKSYYIYNLDYSAFTIIQAIVCIAYMIMVFRSKGNINALKKYAIPALANMVCVCAVNEYKLLSGGNNREFAITVLALTFIYQLAGIAAWALKKIKNKKKILNIISFAAGVLCIAVSVMNEISYKTGNKFKGVYVEALGGNNRLLGKDILRTDRYLDGKRYFSTYASAQEVVSDFFQPSGTDYIIHNLGDEKRENYMKVFAQGDFDYTATIRDSYDSWEYWIERANWFFYRELYKEWHPVYANSYELYWERNTHGESHVADGEVSIKVEDVDESGKKIIIETDDTVNGIADVYIDYSVEKKKGFRSGFIFRTDVKVENTGKTYAEFESCESNYLRPESKEYIAVPIVNGYGETLITSNPSKDTVLNLKEYRCNEIYTVVSDSYRIKSIENGDDCIEFTVNASPRNEESEQTAEYIEYMGEKLKVISVDRKKNTVCFKTEPYETSSFDSENRDNMLRIVRE